MIEPDILTTQHYAQFLDESRSTKKFLEKTSLL